VDSQVLVAVPVRRTRIQQSAAGQQPLHGNCGASPRPCGSKRMGVDRARRRDPGKWSPVV
jgi:hypothetical protein